jgi:hypothetical protein
VAGGGGTGVKTVGREAALERGAGAGSVTREWMSGGSAVFLERARSAVQLRGKKERRGGGVGRRDRRMEEAARAGGVPADRRAAPGWQRHEPDGRTRCRPNRGGGVRLTGGPRQQCRAAVTLMGGARQAAGEGERGASGARAGPRRKRGVEPR